MASKSAVGSSVMQRQHWSLLWTILLWRCVWVESRPLIEPHDAFSLSKSKLFRWRQRWSHKSIGRRLPAIKNKATKSAGTKITLQQPNEERIAAWFWGANAPFNHPTAGMTNPCLHIGLSNDPTTTLTVPVSTVNSASVDDSWWPSTALPLEEASDWRILRFRKRIGHSFKCYQRLRDAALQWEFEAGDKGVMTVNPTPTTVRRGYSIFPTEDAFQPMRSDTVMQIWSGPGKRLVTYTESLGLRARWLPKLWAVNPVSVVYDVVDQRGPFTTYSSTAFATVKGHLFRGEERVTVAYRDDGHVDVEILSLSKPAQSLAGKLVWPFVGGMQRSFFEQQMKSFERVAGPQCNERGSIEAMLDCVAE